MRTCWAILTGEYPPDPGGVSDYTRQVARGLVTRGQEVHVFAPPSKANAPAEPGVAVHRLENHFGLSSLSALGRELDALGPCTLLVQYVPHAFGYRAMNLPLCLWLYARRTRNRIVTMFHEVAYPCELGQPLRHKLIAGANRAMAALLAAASERVLVSIRAWQQMLESLGAPGSKISLAPIFSNLPLAADAQLAAEIRAAHAPGGEQLIGHFGTFGGLIGGMLEAILPGVLAKPARRVLLIGRGSDHFAREFAQGHPIVSENIIATGELDPAQAAAYLTACDAVVQPYPDGLSGRRGTLLAALALGVPVISNLGHLSEDFWRVSGAVALAESSDELVRVVNETMDHPSTLHALSERGPELYNQRFDIRHALDRLLT
jgi:hypothetical protein